MANINISTMPIDKREDDPFVPLMKFFTSIGCYFNRRHAIRNRDAIVDHAVSLLKRANQIVLSCQTLAHWATAERFIALLELSLEKELAYLENHEIPEVLDAKYELDTNFKKLNPTMDYVH